MKMKKVMCLFAAALCACALWAEEMWTDGDGNKWTYTVTSENKARISKFQAGKGFNDTMTVPVKIGGNQWDPQYTVVELSGWGMDGSNNGELKEQKLKNLCFAPGSQVAEIGISTFAGFIALETVEFPESLKTIQNLAFSRCEKLKTVTFAPNSVVTIGRKAFDRCIGLRRVEIPNTIEKIDDFAFDQCSPDLVVVLPPNGVSVGRDAIQGKCEMTVGTAPAGTQALASDSQKPANVFITDRNAILGKDNKLVDLVAPGNQTLAEPVPGSEASRALQDKLSLALSTGEVTPDTENTITVGVKPGSAEAQSVFGDVPMSIAPDPNDPENPSKVVFTASYSFGISKLVWKDKDTLLVTVKLLEPVHLGANTELRLKIDDTVYGTGSAIEPLKGLQPDGTAVFTVPKATFWKQTAGTTRITVCAVKVTP